MRTKPINRHRYFFTLSLIPLMMAGNPDPGYSQDPAFSLYAVSDLNRIFADGYELPDTNPEMELFGIRGEVVSGQCVIQAQANLSSVTVDMEMMRREVGGARIPAASVEWNFVGSVPLKENAPNQTREDILRAAPALFPDYLMAEKEIDLKSETWQAVWLNFHIPVDAEEGVYRGLLHVQSDRAEETLPVSIQVYPFTMPEERHLKVTEWHNTRGFERFHGIQETYSDAWFDMLRIYAENMAAHRQNVFRVRMNSIDIQRLSDGKFAFDFSRFDQIAQVFWNTGKMDYLETGFIAHFETGDQTSREIVLNSFPVTDAVTKEVVTLKGEEVVPHLLPAFEDHLRKKGWLEKTLFHIKDEPTATNARSWREISKYMHSYMPDIQRIDALATSYVIDELEVAVPKIDKLSPWFDMYKEMQGPDMELWLYTVGIYQTPGYPNKTIDVPLMDNRILHWINYRYDLTGFLHWGWNYWTEDPFNDVSMHIGDGWHVYPVKNGVLNSLRWEQMRNGIQDYEYFWLLENKISSLFEEYGLDHFALDPSQTGKEIARSLVYNLHEYNPDPNFFYQCKKSVIEALINLETSPKLYVQTNPLANSTILHNDYIEIMGWVEPGARVFINGEETFVDTQGIFVLPRTQGLGSGVEIKALLNGQEKVMHKSFTTTGKLSKGHLIAH